MESFHIEGGVPLSGAVRVDGAKNAALPACIASLLTDEPVVLHRVPQLRDVSTILYTLGALGRHVVRHGNHVSIAAGTSFSPVANDYSVRQMRASFLVLAPLVARLGRAVVPLPGGCAIGRRPVDLHLDGLRALGARVEEEDGVITVTAERLVGARIALPYPSVGATEQILMAATLAHGETVIENGAIEPEVGDLVSLLRAMGAEIGNEDRIYRVAGASRLHGAEHELIPDRMEAGTFLLAGAMTRGAIVVEGTRSDHLLPLLGLLETTGAEVTIERDAIAVHGTGRPRPIEVVTAPHPGFPTDLHPPLAAYLSLGSGSSSLAETVFDGRFSYVDALCEMGARIARAGTTLAIDGIDSLHGRPVSATDIRGGAAMILAGLAADGYTTVNRLEHVDRGYARLEEKLKELGAKIERRNG